MSRKQRLAYAIFAAEQVINFYEKQYPQDKRPRAAIEATKSVLLRNTKKTRAAAYAAANAAREQMQLKIIDYGIGLLKRGDLLSSLKD